MQPAPPEPHVAGDVTAPAAGASAPLDRRRATIDIAVQIAGRLVNLAMGVVWTVLVVRTLGDSAFGQWSTILAVGTLAGTVADLGLEKVAVGQAASEPEREGDWMGALVTLGFAIALPAAAVSFGLVLLVSDGSDMVLAGLLICALLLVAPIERLRAVFQLRMRNDVSVAVLTFHSVVWGAAVVVLAATDAGLVAFAIAFAVTSLARVGLQAVLSLRAGVVRLRGSRRLWGELGRVALPVGIASTLTVAYSRIDQVLVFELAGARDAGLYGAVHRILEQAQFIPIAVMTTFFPVLAAAHPGDPGRVRRVFQVTMDSLALVSLPALAFTIVAAGPIVRLLFGPGFAEAAPALPILMTTFAIVCFGYLAGNMIIVLKLQRQFLVYAVLALVVNVGLNFALVGAYGFVAAAWITVATEILVMSLAMRAVLRAMQWRPRVDRVLRVALAAGVMGALVALARAGGVPLAALVVIAAASYPPLLLLLRAVDVGALRAIVRRKVAT